MKKYENAKEWFEEVETVLNKFMKDEGIKEDDLTADTLSTKIINKWVKWVEKDGSRIDWKKAGAVLYDFVEDTLSKELLNEYHELNSYEKFLVYKYNNPNWNVLKDRKKDKYRFQEMAKKYNTKDPDLYSKFLQAIYGLLWDKLSSQNFMKCKNWIYSDTMTSAMVRLTDAMKEIISCENSNENINEKNMSEEIRSIYDACQDNQKWWTANFCIIVGEIFDKDFYDMIDKHYPPMQEFLNLCHTVGNYCPVPKGFNGARSGDGAEHDYWDITLEQIHQWYESKDENVLAKLLHKDEQWKSCKQCSRCSSCNTGKHINGLLENCKKWLQWFEKEENKKDEKYTGWQNFVETLCLQDYVDINNTYKPIPFWENHGWKDDDKKKSPSLPNNEEAINKALQEINRRIIARSLRIAVACREKLKEDN